MTTVDDSDLLESEWVATPRRRSRLRYMLLMLLAVSLVFWAGTLTQKHLGTAASGAATAGPGGFGGGPGGLGGAGGGLPDLGGGQNPFGGGAQGVPQDGAVGETAEDAGTSVIGTVVEVDGDTWIVENLGGDRITVTVSGDTDVTREEALDAAEVTAGTRVDIGGTETGTADAPEVAAQDVTIR